MTDKNVKNWSAHFVENWSKLEPFGLIGGIFDIADKRYPLSPALKILALCCAPLAMCFFPFWAVTYILVMFIDFVIDSISGNPWQS